MRQLAKRTLTSRLVSTAWAPFIRDCVTFVMMHRFAQPDLGLLGHDRQAFKRVLEKLRRHRYEMLSVDEAVHRLMEGVGFPKRSVVFTMDDGYHGAVEQCADLFMAYDCPLTIFVATGFIDGICWLWWDQIEYICLKSSRSTLQQRWGAQTIDLDLRDRRATILSVLRTSNFCKGLRDDEKWRFIRCLARAAEVDIPERAPIEYAPLTWTELRALEKRGFSVGPHTVTHPILPKTPDAAAEWEITESWQRVRQELAHPLPVFAYPNGSYGPRELEILSALDLRAAVTTRGAYASPAARTDRFEIPRFGYPEVPEMLLMITSGLRGASLTLRGRAFV